MVINHLEKLFVTSDAATIIKESDVHHPAAKMVAQASQMQENECGDGANFLLTLAGELCSQAQSLLQMGLHPSDILLGYEKASRKAHEIFDHQVAYSVKDITDYDEVLRCMKTSVMSKQYGLEDTMGSLITSACLMSLSSRTKKINVENIRVQKILGGGIGDSEVVRGMVIIRQSETTVHHVTDGKVAVFNTNIEMN